MPRYLEAVRTVESRGLTVKTGRCMNGDGVVSAPAIDRADELMEMLLDPEIKAVVPPWGGELAIDILTLLDFRALERVPPTWVVGYSDISTVLVPLTTKLGWATLHGQNLLDTPYRVPAPLLSWLDVVMSTEATLTQGPSTAHRAAGHDDWVSDPTVTEYSFDSAGTWRRLDGSSEPLRVSGRLIGGCIETVSPIAGTELADVVTFASDFASDDGLLVYIEAAESNAADIARNLWRLRLTGWFDHANAVLVGRTNAPNLDGFTQLDAVVSVLADLDIPVVVDVDCGHVPPHLALINGLVTEVSVSTHSASLVQGLPSPR